MCSTGWFDDLCVVTSSIELQEMLLVMGARLSCMALRRLQFRGVREAERS